jgi:hypothetical protein
MNPGEKGGEILASSAVVVAPVAPAVAFHDAFARACRIFSALLRDAQGTVQVLVLDA